MKVICAELASLGLVDYYNIIAHTNITHTGRSKHWAPTPTPHGVFVDLASAIKAVVNVPVFTVGRVVDPRHAERIIAEGHADMVGMTRAHICDPTIVSKVRQNKLAEIRPCVGANTCIANRYAGKPIKCMHNPELKVPGATLLQSESPKTVVVVGAGPAGLEVARLSATRGHDVTLYEASSQLGGQLEYWSRSTSMRELRRIIDWREQELVRLGVSVKLNRPLLGADLLQLSVDDIVIATGATERSRLSSEGSEVLVLTPRQLLDMSATNAKRAVVINDGRGQAGLVAAEWLSDHGVHVEIVTEDVAVANDLDPTNRNSWYQRLGEAGVILTTQLEPVGIVENALVLKNVFTQHCVKREHVDLIVDWCGCHAVDGLLRLQTMNANVSWHAIGDCIAPRNVEVAMAEALAVAE